MSDEGPRGRLERLWKSKGFWCMAVGYYHGRRCGYVLVSESHPYHGIEITGNVPNPRDLTNEPVGEDHRIPIIPLFAASFSSDDDWQGELQFQLRVHGGVTFSAYVDDWNEILEEHDGIPSGWWIGFDCGHAGDGDDYELMKDPEYRKYKEALDRRFPKAHEGDHVWTTPEVVAEIEFMVEQLVEAGLRAGVTNGNGS